MWDLVGNPEDRFSHNEAHIISDMVISQKDVEHKLRENKRTGLVFYNFLVKKCVYLLSNPHKKYYRN